MRIEIDTSSKTIKIGSGTLGELVDFMKEHFENWEDWQIISDTIYYPPNGGIIYCESEYPNYKITKTGEHTIWVEK